MDDLWWRTQDQRAFVEIHILRENHEVSAFPVLPDLRIGCRQQIEVEKMFGLVAMRFQPVTEAWWKIRVDREISLAHRDFAMRSVTGGIFETGIDIGLF